MPIPVRVDDRRRPLSRPHLHYGRSGRIAAEHYEDVRLREPDDKSSVPLYLDPDIWDPLHPETFYPPGLNEGVFRINLHGHLTRLAPERSRLILMSIFPWWYHLWAEAKRLIMVDRASHFRRRFFSSPKSNQKRS
ncbi:hypothetical protein GGS26DRAFT_516226 [Hypomontagnella submonticulosa]|nr:hypothetical protein GGS26DRAFT_516226 [Hypomontagnella submonticulosa]